VSIQQMLVIKRRHIKRKQYS